MHILKIFSFTGFFHEHTRSDRDKYITIEWKNIPTSWKHNFRPCTDRKCNDLKVGYDFRSIMHYGPRLKGKTAIVAKKKGVTFGQRSKLSKKDLIGINEFYCGGKLIVNL